MDVFDKARDEYRDKCKKLTKEEKQKFWNLAHDDCTHYLCARRIGAYSKKALCPSCCKRRKAYMSDYVKYGFKI